MSTSKFFVMDLGSSKIASLCAEYDDNKITGYNLSISEGTKSGIITDVKKVEKSIIDSVFSLEKVCKKNVKSTKISLSGIGIKSDYLCPSLKITGEVISQSDIERVINKGLKGIKDRDVIQYFPIEFMVDKQAGIVDPLGMLCNELSCTLHVVSVNSNFLVNVINCFMKCQIEVEEVVTGIYASGLACLSDNEKTIGSVIIDIGSRTTSFGVFLDGKFIYSKYIPMGSSHISSDISKVFSLDFKLAEQLKVVYGSAIQDQNPININLDEEGSNHSGTVSSKNLNEVIQARLEEISSFIKKDYEKYNIDKMVSCIVLTGGGALLSHISDFFAEKFDKDVRIADVKSFNGFDENLNSNMYTSALGVVKHTFSNTTVPKRGGVIGKIFSWIKQSI
jgi:cell division protein FtsA